MIPLLWQKSRAYIQLAPTLHPFKPQPYLQQLIDIISDIVVDKFWVKGSEICVIDVFEDKGGRFALHQE
jgi:hypothetical protein